MFDDSNNIYIIEEVKGGGLKKYIDNFKKKYKNSVNISSLKNITFHSDDILFIQNLYFTNIEILEILNLEIRIILCLHDFYWLHEFVMRQFYNDEYPPVHTNYLRENILIHEDIKNLFKKAHKIICPSKFVLEHYKKYFNDNNFIYKPHDDIDIIFSNDLILKINVATSPDYERNGDTLIKSFDLPLKTALFGGKIEVKTIHKDITLKVPQNTKQSQRFRVKELGVLNRKSGVKGDLYLKANIVLPKIEDLDEDLVKILEEKLPSN